MFTDQEWTGILISLIPAQFIVLWIEPKLKAKYKNPYLRRGLILLIWLVSCLIMTMVMDWIFDGKLM